MATILIIDSGLFTHWAEAMAHHFERVMYFCDYKRMMPKCNQKFIGSGLVGVDRIYDLWDHIDDADVIFFTDVGTGDLQEYLRANGYNVWGAGRGEDLELDRIGLKRLMDKCGLKTTKHHVVTGVTNLMSHLKTVKNKWIKVSEVRGDWETTHHIDSNCSRNLMLDFAHKLGGNAEKIQFIVEDPIPDAVEVGYDGWCIDGKYPATNQLSGIEIKDCGYAGAIASRYDDIHPSVRDVNSKLSWYMKEMGYRGCWSTEIRVTKNGDSYLIDPTARLGSPPSQLYEEMYSNWKDIIMAGSNGQIVEPKVVKPYGVMAVICSDGSADGEHQVINIPNKSQRWVKMRHKQVIDGTALILPQDVNFKQIGFVVGIGNTFKEAVEHCVANAEGVEGDGVSINTDAIPDAIEQIQQAGEIAGMKFGEKKLPSKQQIEEAVS